MLASDFARCSVAVALLTVSAASHSQAIPTQGASSAVRMPTDAEMARQRVRMPTEAELAKQPPVILPNLGRADAPMQKGIDAGALAAQFEAMRHEGEQGASRQLAGLLVFVTSQMPRATLERLVDQAERSAATLVLRGLKDRSLRDTMAAAADLIGRRKVAWIIDPESFRRFEVSRTPTFVLVDPRNTTQVGCNAGACAAEPKYSKVAGDVSTAFALETIEREDPSFRAQAAAFRRKLEAKR